MKSAACVAVLALMLASGSQLFAQYRPNTPGYPGLGPPRPAFSPYLNLLGSGNPAANYYGIVRPQQEFRGAIAGLQQQTSSLEQQGQDPTDPSVMRGTGHVAFFNNLSHYYYNNPATGFGGRGGIPGGGLGASRPTPSFGGGSLGLGGGRGSATPSLGGSLPTRR